MAQAEPDMITPSEKVQLVEDVADSKSKRVATGLKEPSLCSNQQSVSALLQLGAVPGRPVQPLFEL